MLEETQPSEFLLCSSQLGLYDGFHFTSLKIQNVSKSWYIINHPTHKVTGPLMA